MYSLLHIDHIITIATTFCKRTCFLLFDNKVLKASSKITWQSLINFAVAMSLRRNIEANQAEQRSKEQQIQEQQVQLKQFTAAVEKKEAKLQQEKEIHEEKVKVKMAALQDWEARIAKDQQELKDSRSELEAEKRVRCMVQA